jgi:hypothetical protein
MLTLIIGKNNLRKSVNNYSICLIMPGRIRDLFFLTFQFKYMKIKLKLSPAEGGKKGT